ncbi:MAG: choice-of-anchor D domain-containing protein [Desulfobacteraceae bacterium]|nr:choice-of-anchor D domain-containing protein [Desulfobacteraceae bacterium]
MSDIAEGSDIYVGTAVNTTDAQSSARRDSYYSYQASFYGYAYASYPKKRQSSSQAVLKLREADIYLEGKVLDQNGSPVDDAFVSAYSKDSQTTQRRTDSSGAYSLHVAQAGTTAGNAWTVNAVKKEKGDTTYYRSQKAGVSTCGTDEVFTAPDLTVESAGTFPASVTRRFQVDDTWTLTLEDGFHIEIPSLTVETRKQTVMVTVEPLVDSLPHNTTNHIVNNGYSIILIEKETGKQLHELNNDVILSFSYTDEQLATMGIDESDIYPASYSTLSQMWYPKQNFILDEASNKVIFRTRHVSGTWALVTAETLPGVTDPEMDVKGNSISIADGSTTPSASDHTDFGEAVMGRTVKRTFTIANSGDMDLTIGNIIFSGTNNQDFSVTTPPASTVEPGSETTFTLAFAPKSKGTTTAEISIANSDCNEKTYNFAISGTGVAFGDTDKDMDVDMEYLILVLKIIAGISTSAKVLHHNLYSVP